MIFIMMKFDEIFRRGNKNTVIGPRSCLSHRELLCHMYFMKIRPGCEEISSRVNGWKIRFLEVWSETKIFIINIALLTSAGHD